MELRALGRSGARVSRLGLGTMTWGRDTDEHEARDQLGDFLDAGGTLVDTADVYVDGRSEEILGQLLASVGRDRVFVATKAAARASSTRRIDASRGHLLRALDASLTRLGVEDVDLWQLHAWDPYTPLEETLSAVDVAITSGRARYVGVSNYTGWQSAAAVCLQRDRTIVASQVEYSLLDRGVEREVIPAATEFGLGILPWSPLGRGVLSGKYRHGTPADSRGASAHFAGFVAPYLTYAHRSIVEAVSTAADGLGLPAVQVALAWVRDRPGVVAPIVGARTALQLRGLLASEDVALPEEITKALDEVSAP